MNKAIAGALVTLLGLSVLPARADDLSQRLCALYKEQLKSYQLEGVHAYNPATGRREKLDAREARKVIEAARENMKFFCNEQGVVR